MCLRHYALGHCEPGWSRLARALVCLLNNQAYEHDTQGVRSRLQSRGRVQTGSDSAGPQCGAGWLCLTDRKGLRRKGMHWGRALQVDWQAAMRSLLSVHVFVREAIQCKV